MDTLTENDDDLFGDLYFTGAILPEQNSLGIYQPHDGYPMDPMFSRWHLENPASPLSFPVPATAPATAPAPAPAPAPASSPAPSLAPVVPQSPNVKTKGTKRKKNPADLGTAAPKTKKCVRYSCKRCRSRKQKCDRDGDGPCKGCVGAAKPCVRDGKDGREKNTLLDAFREQERGYHEAHRAAAFLIAKARDQMGGMGTPDAFYGAIRCLADPQNVKTEALVQKLPMIAQVAGMDPGQVSPPTVPPIPQKDVTTFNRAELKRHTDAFSEAAGLKMANLRKGLVAIMTPISEWPGVETTGDDFFCLHLNPLDVEGIMAWAESSPWAGQLLESWQARGGR